MPDTLYNEIEELKREGGDIYQKYADRHGVTRSDAKAYLFQFMYSKDVKEIPNA